MARSTNNGTAFARTKRRSAPRPSKAYIVAEFAVKADLADDAAALLVQGGALGCAVKGDLLRGRLRATVVLQAFFERLSARELARLERMLNSARMLAPATPGEHIERLVDPGWSTLWQSRFKPLKIGRRFLVVPPWSRLSDPARLRIVIQPGQAFGTGHHPTTSGVLRALEVECLSRRIRSALDVGTGSGVLAIAMKLLDVTKVVGVDVAPEAITEARRNAELNGLSGAIRFSTARLSALRRPFDLIAANISERALGAAASDLKRLLAAGGSLILSGMLKGEAKALLERYRPELRCLRERSYCGWTTLVLGA